MDQKTKTFLGVMIFYIVLSYVIFPLVFYNYFEKSLISAGNGFICGSILSIVLWVFYGKTLISKGHYTPVTSFGKRLH